MTTVGTPDQIIYGEVDLEGKGRGWAACTDCITDIACHRCDAGSPVTVVDVGGERTAYHGRGRLQARLCPRWTSAA